MITNDEFARTRHEQVVAYFKESQYLMEVPMKTAKMSNYDRSLGQYSNPRPPTYEAGARINTPP